MNKMQLLNVPTEQELTEWFGCIPVKMGEGQYRYEVSDGFGVKLLFSFDVIEASVQTILSAAGKTILTVVREGERKIWLHELTGPMRLSSEWHSERLETALTVELEPRIHVEWASLRG